VVLLNWSQCIGATTLDEYTQHIEKDPALERRFQPVEVPEPTVDEAIQILKGLRERYEIHHKVQYTDEAIEAAAQLSSQFIRYVCVAFLTLHHLDQYQSMTKRIRATMARIREIMSLAKQCFLNKMSAKN